MIGRFCDTSTRHTRNDISSDEGGQELRNYACPICGSHKYHLVFRVEALTHRTTMVVECGRCRFRKELASSEKAVA